MITETPCAICRRRASGHGFGYRNRAFIRACADERCQKLLPKVYTMPKNELDAFEVKAIRHGGEQAGAYLDSLGKHDLAQMSAEEWDTFCACMITEYGEHMRWMLENNEPPF